MFKVREVAGGCCAGEAKEPDATVPWPFNGSEGIELVMPRLALCSW